MSNHTKNYGLTSNKPAAHGKRLSHIFLCGFLLTSLTTPGITAYATESDTYTNVTVESNPIEKTGDSTFEEKPLSSELSVNTDVQEESHVDSSVENPLFTTTASSEEGSETIQKDTAMDMQTYTWEGLTLTLDEEGTLHIPEGNVTDPAMILTYVTLPDNPIKKIQFDGNLTVSGNISYLFYGSDTLEEIVNLNRLNTSNVTDMQYLFADSKKLTSLDLSSWDTSNVTDMTNMFGNCSALTSLDLSGFSTSNVTSMRRMFSGLPNLETIDLSHFDTSNVTDMSFMFGNCSALTSLDLSGFNTSNVTDMSGMFWNLTNLETIDLSHFDTSNVTNMSYMFYYTNKLETLNIGNFDTSNVTDMEGIFEECNALATLTLGSNFKFISGEIAGLPSIATTDTYTGFWQNVGTGTLDNPSGTNIWTSQEFMNQYDGLKDSDTYVWQSMKLDAQDLTVNYQDIEGNTLAKSKTISGKIGDNYDVSTDEYKLEIEGYSLSEVHGSTVGTLSNTEQTVTYIYTKDSVPDNQGEVTVSYVDNLGKSLSKSIVLTGEIDSPFNTKAIQIDGYILDTDASKEEYSGVFSETKQEIIFVYKKESIIENTSERPIEQKIKENSTNQPSSNHLNSPSYNKNLPKAGESINTTYLSIGLGVVFSSVIIWFFNRRNNHN